MNIGFDAKRLFNNFTGLGNYSRTLLKNLLEFYPNNSYHLYTPKYKSNSQTQFFLKSPYQLFFPKFPKLLWRSYLITNQLKKDNIDLYHGLSHELPLNVKNSGIKSVVTIHDLIFKKYPQTFPLIDRSIYDFKFKRACANADTIVAISESTKKDIVELYDIDHAKIKVVYQSCQPLYYQPSSLAEKEIKALYGIPDEYLLFVGSVETRKNVKLLIEAYRHLHKDFRIPLVIVGRPRQGIQEIRALIESVGMAHLVIWIENLSDNEHLQVLYQEAQAFIYPSLYEGFGLPVVEALLSRTPVITSNVSSLPEAGGPNSLYINPLESEDLAQAIEKVLTDVGLRQTMIAKGFEYAHSRFGRRVVTDTLVDIYLGT
ncbi:MAG TPA: glycosyltransferase family 1 protein [Saprospiraceae bacterium]|nr:glycosyltransferase family 1 protein [Saprospiraceae bacterium]